MGMSVIYVKRSGPEREIRAKNDYLFGEPGNGCALFAAGFCMYEYNEAYVHYYDAWCELLYSVLHHGYILQKKCV
jgi:hypothetical protein